MAAPPSTFDQFAIDKLIATPGPIREMPFTTGSVNFEVPQVGYGNIDFPYSYTGRRQADNPIGDAVNKLFRGGPTQQFMASPITFNEDEINAARYMSSPDYYKLGISLSGDNEERYGQNQSWSEVLSNGIVGMGRLAYNGFVDGWKQWGRTYDAISNLDWSKLHGDTQSMLELDNNLKEIMNSNPIYATKEGTETFWNRQTFGNFLQQSGFTVGALGQMLSEQIITKAIESVLVASVAGAPAAGALETTADVKAAATVGRIGRFFQKGKEFYDAAKNFKALKKLGDVWKNEAALQNFFTSIGQKIPGVDIAMDMTRAAQTGAKAGLSGTKLATDVAKVGLGGLKRTMSEANFAFSEARMEAAGTFGDLYNQMQDDFFKKNGTFAKDEDLQTMQNVAMQAADKNFNFNSAVLGVSNRIMFDNIFKNSKATSKILSKFGEDVGEKGFKVLGKINGRNTTQYYTGGILSNYKQIAADFGTKKARQVLAGSIMKPALKFEVTEGIQELLQEGSNEYYKDYYLNSYKAKFDPTIEVSSEKSFDKAVKSQMNMQGLKTFASGALTGMMIHGPTLLVSKSLSKISETIEDKYKTQGFTEEEKEKYYQQKKKRKEELKNYYNEFNAIAKDPSKFFSESVKNFNVQKEGASALDEAAKLGDKFAYENIRTDMLHGMVSQAVRNNTHEALVDTLREYGKNMSKEEFEQAFVGIDYSSENKKSAQDYTEKVANSVESYAKTYNKLQDKYGSRVNPNRYQFGSKEYQKELHKKQVLNNMIDILAGNEFKATDAINRSTELFNNASKHKTLGTSLATAYNILGSDVNMKKELTTLDLEISTKKEQVKSEGISKEDKKQIQSEIELKEKQKQAIQDWLDNKDELINDVKVAKSYEAFKSYLELKNKEYGKESTVNVNEVEDLFVDFNDYIKLNKKFQSHVDAVNMLSNPQYFDQIYERMVVGSELAFYQMLHDSAQEKIKSGLVDENAHFIIEVNGRYGIFSPQGNIVSVVDDLDKARKIKEQLDEAIFSTEGLEEILSEVEKNEKEDLEKKEEELKKQEEIEDEKPITSTDYVKLLINGKVAFVKDKFEDEDGAFVYNYFYETEPTVNRQFKIIGNKKIDVETGEELTISKIETEEKLGEKSIDEQIAEIENKIQSLPDKGLEIVGDEFVPTQELTDLRNQLETLKKQKETQEKKEEEVSDIEAKKADIEKRRQEELTKEFGRNIELVKSGQKAVISRTPDLVKLSSDPQVADARAQEVIDKYNTINAKYDAELTALEGKKEITTEETEQTGVEDRDQTFNGKKDLTDTDSKESEKVFQSGIKQTAPALSLAQRTHSVDIIEVSPGVERFERGDVNQTYEFEVATPTFAQGKSITFKVDEFDGKNYNDANIGIYSIIDGKETRIGAIHTPMWISERRGVNNEYTHIVIPEEQKHLDVPPVLEAELKANRALRKLILDNYKVNPTFVLNGSVIDKSMGIIATQNDAGLLKDRLNPEIGKGGMENRHGMFAIVRNGFIEIGKNTPIDSSKLVNIKSFDDTNIGQYEGYSLMLVPTPVGTYFPTFIKLPRVAREQSEFILKAWKVFTKKESDVEFVKAVYDATGSEYLEGTDPDINVLKNYIEHYITNLSDKSLSSIKNGSDVENGIARLDIYNDGNMRIQGKTEDGRWINKVIKTESDIPSDILDYMDNLLTTVRFDNAKNTALKGINSTEDATILGVKNNKLIVDKMPYNQYIMNGARTYLERGVESNNKYNDWVYFANPVVKFDYITPSKDAFEEEINKESVDVNLADINAPKQDLAASLLAALQADEIDDDQVDEQKNNCSGGK